MFYTEATAELGQWIAVDVDEIVISSGGFWVAVNNLTDTGPYDGLALDLAASGMYLYKLSTNEKTFVKKMLMLK